MVYNPDTDGGTLHPPTRVPNRERRREARHVRFVRTASVRALGEKPGSAVTTKGHRTEHTELEHKDSKGRGNLVGEHPPDLISLAMFRQPD